MQHAALTRVETPQIRTDLPDLRIGDTLKVHVKIKEGDKERIQIFEGTLIARKNKGISETITVRKMSFSTGVERIFPLNSPRIESIEVAAKGLVRRSRLFYLRERAGKAARVRDVKDR